ncbi:MAG: inovirus Gp2 family protein [Acinetobacter populi]|jgi:hypothetical protein|uniref:YagK/YfjJ domain-containing protein n=1 Tax=Acinetobacter populi TaxID=1582270 RepID=UPI002356A861|nr:inovirus-type Gp2 protein [Acinetobacter populi]MCH4247044.1 inovirus Gp2 family protein [Acinetobacter populi]
MNQVYILLNIENLMLSVLKRSYHWKDFQFDYEQLRPQAKRIYDHKLSYSPLVQCYFDLMPQQISFEDMDIFESRRAFQSFQQELREIHQQFTEDLYHKQQYNQKQLLNYFDTLVQRHRKLLLVRVDLYYQFEAMPEIQRFNQDIKVLLNRIQNKDTCFKGQVGYAYRLEQGGQSKGFHCHLLVIYNGSEHCRDDYLGERIGMLWQDITRDDGYYHNCNQRAHKRKYQQLDRLGIGLIQRSDEALLYNARKTICYLAQPNKDNQYLRVRLSKKMRQFHTGQLLKMKRDYQYNAEYCLSGLR